MALAMVAALVLSSCGTRGEDRAAVSGAAAAQGQSRAGSLEPVSTGGDPRDLVTVGSCNSGANAVWFGATYETYAQLRDYSDTTVIGRVLAIRVPVGYEPPYVLPGELEVDVEVDEVLGGRSTRVSPGARLTVWFPTYATRRDLDRLLPRLDLLVGARYALFLALVEPHGQEDLPLRYTPMCRGAPPPILAEWPGDGRLTDLVPHDYLAREAIARGDVRTGTKSPPEPKWEPTFAGQPPIGLTVAEAVAEFAGTPGVPAVDPPPGWDLDERSRPGHPA